MDTQFASLAGTSFRGVQAEGIVQHAKESWATAETVHLRMWWKIWRCLVRMGAAALQELAKY
jgi:hypothetical protein